MVRGSPDHFLCMEIFNSKYLGIYFVNTWSWFRCYALPTIYFDIQSDKDGEQVMIVLAWAIFNLIFLIWF